MTRQIGLLGLLLIALSTMNVSAKSADTKYTHYLIAGKNAASLNVSMCQKGPRVGNGRAYASATMTPKAFATTARHGDSCRIDTFKLSMQFTIRLPKLKKAAAVTPAARKNFDDFYRFAKKHEETHRSIWLECAAEAEKLVIGTRARTCSGAEAKGLRIVTQVANRCDGRHKAFDASEHKRLAKHPFIKQAAKSVTGF